MANIRKDNRYTKGSGFMKLGGRQYVDTVHQIFTFPGHLICNYHAI